MIKIQRLVKPNKHSGYPLEPGQTIRKRGLTIINTGNVKGVWVDVWKRKPEKKARRKK